MRNYRCLSTYTLPAPTIPTEGTTYAPYRVLYLWVFFTFTPVFFSEANILLAVIGLVGVLGTGVVLTYGFVRAPRAL